jgi:hypothetical protein
LNIFIGRVTWGGYEAAHLISLYNDLMIRWFGGLTAKYGFIPISAYEKSITFAVSIESNY